jgi:hypothetical protein
MNKKPVLLIFFISLILSTASSINQSQFIGFLTNNLLSLPAIFFGLFFIYKKIFFTKNKNIKNKIIAILLLLIFEFFWQIIISSFTFSVSPAMELPPHFRTNILTKQCSFGGSSGYFDEPWYYRDGCNLPKDKQIKILLKSSEKDIVKEECQKECNNKLESCDYSIETFLSQSDIRCSDLLNK